MDARSGECNLATVLGTLFLNLEQVGSLSGVLSGDGDPMDPLDGEATAGVEADVHFSAGPLGDASRRVVEAAEFGTEGGGRRGLQGVQSCNGTRDAFPKLGADWELIRGNVGVWGPHRSIGRGRRDGTALKSTKGSERGRKCSSIKSNESILVFMIMSLLF